jgi:hypothetical protein
LILAAAHPQPSLAAPTEITNFKGRFLGFVEVDHRWAVFCIQGDSVFTVGISNGRAGRFVAALAGAILDIEVKVIDTYEEDGAEKPIYGMTEASLNGYTAAEWESDCERALGYRRAHELFESLADSMVMDREPPTCKH